MRNIPPLPSAVGLRRSDLLMCGVCSDILSSPRSVFVVQWEGVDRPLSATSTGAKNRVDRRVGDCRQRWSLACCASDSVETKARQTTVRIADVGAGLLSMLELVLDRGCTHKSKIA